MVPRKRLELLHLAATASKTVMSTIPSPGQICLVLEMGLEPTHPKAYASETYVSTIPPPERATTIYKKGIEKQIFDFTIFSYNKSYYN